MTAIAAMVDYLLHRHEGWKPDRQAVVREKTCTRCGTRKHFEKFTFAGAVCKACDKELRKRWLRTGRRA
jgi:uncharacterized protein (DUF983 family)